MEELWKPVDGYEGKYEVSNFGRVFSRLSNRFIGGSPDDKGYLRVKLYGNNGKKSIRVHQLVARAFIPNIANYTVINHIDEDKLNNRFDNLEWCTQQYNMNAGSLPERWRSRPSCKPVVAVKGLLKIKFPSVSKAAERLGGLNQSHISACCRGNRKTHKGWSFIWA